MQSHLHLKLFPSVSSGGECAYVLQPRGGGKLSVGVAGWPIEHAWSADSLPDTLQMPMQLLNMQATQATIRRFLLQLQMLMLNLLLN